MKTVELKINVINLKKKLRLDLCKNVSLRQCKLNKHLFFVCLRPASAKPVGPGWGREKEVGGVGRWHGQLSVNLPPDSHHGHELQVTTLRIRSQTQGGK